jgi:hypothetical protein
MNVSDLSTTEIAIIGAVIVILGGVFVYLLQKRRTTRLRREFGEAEYDLAVMERGNRRQAEATLSERSKRVHALRVHALTPSDRARFAASWEQVQAHFVDRPAGAIAEADQLLGDLLAARGYPAGDYEQRAADISVHHPTITQHYREAHAIALNHVNGKATTEDLRRAMIHYRTLFDELMRDSTAVAA